MRALVIRAGEIADLVEAEARALCHVDDREAVQHRLVVATLTSDAFGRGQDADPLVIANVRRVDAGSGGDVADGQCCHCPSPLT
jgi:hypothetical protein